MCGCHSLLFKEFWIGLYGQSLLVSCIFCANCSDQWSSESFTPIVLTRHLLGVNIQTPQTPARSINMCENLGKILGLIVKSK